MRLLLLALIAVVGLRAESPPVNWAGAGAAYNQYAQPQANGWVAMATLLTDKGPIYSFTEETITSAKTKPFTVQTSATTGFATLIKQYGPVSVFGFGTAGMATSVGSIGSAFAGGGVGIWKLGKTNWSLVFGAQFLKTTSNAQTVYSFGVGRAF